MKSRTLLKRLTDYGLSVKQVDNKIRLAPLNLINDNVLVFVRDNKEALLTALAEESQEKNFTIGNPKPIYNCNCGLRPPFCSCIGPQVAGLTACALCANFEPDSIGDGAGIGLCKKVFSGLRKATNESLCIDMPKGIAIYLAPYHGRISFWSF